MFDQRGEGGIGHRAGGGIDLEQVAPGLVRRGQRHVVHVLRTAGGGKERQQAHGMRGDVVGVVERRIGLDLQVERMGRVATEADGDIVDRAGAEDLQRDLQSPQSRRAVERLHVDQRAVQAALATEQAEVTPQLFATVAAMPAATHQRARDRLHERGDACVRHRRYAQWQHVHHHRRYPRGCAAKPAHERHTDHGFLLPGHAPAVFGSERRQHVRPRLADALRAGQQCRAQVPADGDDVAVAVMRGRGEAAAEAGRRGHPGHGLAPEGGVLPATFRDTVGGVLIEHRRQCRKRRTGVCIAACAIQRADPIGEQRHAVTVGGEVMHAEVPDEAIRTQPVQVLHREAVAHRIDRGAAVAPHGVARGGRGIDGHGQVDEFKPRQVRVVDDLPGTVVAITHAQPQRSGFVRGAVGSAGERRDIERAIDPQRMRGIERRVVRRQPLRVPQAGLGLGQRPAGIGSDLRHGLTGIGNDAHGKPDPTPLPRVTHMAADAPDGHPRSRASALPR